MYLHCTVYIYFQFKCLISWRQIIETGEYSSQLTFQRANELVLSAFGILHNCAKVDENKPMYRKLNIMQYLLPYTLPNNKNRMIMDALMTMSYIVEGDMQHLVQANDASVEFILVTLKDAVNNTERHQSREGYHAYEIAIGRWNVSFFPCIRPCKLWKFS